MAGVDVGLLVGLISSLAGALAWYRSLARSQYARERELAHILKNQEQSNLVLRDLVDQVDELGDRLTKHEALLISAIGRQV
ncbi:hypothetical protein H6G89_14565 [Oscillatoria sp. FACHB-1407]|uniref:hypothetical protein n=1 Tax=Oscillatoria sp. FACHB-1407 TaxID=2692847 RepID=UPI00168900B2|nr:hypothetical protein [Oscillatoria sp. FACHB-1407]MBD2462268.1 hypothetical protein [Oscillatoria sp. FACHB-1407]